MAPVELKSKTYEVAEAWEWYELCCEKGWTDGLPVLPPTEDRVRAIVEYLGRDPQEVIGIIPPKQGIATVEKIAINCAMAGCKPEYVPVVLAAVEAMLEEKFNLNGVQCTTNACAPLVIVSGPIVKRLGFHYREGVFGGGSRANATIGRAVRLIMLNIGGGIPGETDMATLGSGLGAEDSAVTVFACDPPHSILTPGDGVRVLKIVAATLPTVGVNAFHCAGEILVVFGPRPAQAVAQLGLSKADVKKFLYENARYNLGRLKELGVMRDDEATMTHWGGVPEAPWMIRLTDEQMLPMVVKPEDIHIVVAGGLGQWWCAFCPGWGNYGGYAVTKKISTP